MITAVDTSVLLDIFTADPNFVTASQTALRQALQTGSLSVCAIVVAEIRPCFPTREQLIAALETLGASTTPISQQAACIAGETWQKYRRAGGKRERLIPDFLIAAHAQTSAEYLLTRDRGFYRRWFKDLQIIEP